MILAGMIPAGIFRKVKPDLFFFTLNIDLVVKMCLAWLINQFKPAP
jgi:hypothetical protein